MELSIAIVTHNTSAYLRSCLQSILLHAPECRYEIIVVDNGSSDATVPMLHAEFPQVLLIQNTQNEGFTRPLNQALKQAKGRFLIALNPDTIIHAHTFTPLLAYMEAHPQVGILTPKVLNADGSLQKQCRRGEARPLEVFGYFFHLAKLFPHNRALDGYLMSYLPENEIVEVKAVSGSFMLIRRAVIEQIGFFDEGFFAYQEDSDFCFRARQAGWKIIYNPQAQITHFGGMGGSGSQPMRGIYEWHRSFFRYYRKHMAKDYFFLFNWFFYGIMLAKLLLALLKALFSRKKIVGTPKPGV